MYWIEFAGAGRLAIAARPRAGDWLTDEVAGWRAAGVDCVVSLLEPHEVQELGLEDEQHACAQAGIAFVSFPIADRGVPESPMKTRALVSACRNRHSEGQSLLVHCRAGIGRSALISACVLAGPGADMETIFARIGAARGLDVPDTPAQKEWATAFTVI